MDSDIHPSYYCDKDPESAIAATKATIQHINTVDPDHNLLTPILTPRFAPSCTSSLLSALGFLAKDQNLPIQTHISENPAECALVASRFPDSQHYTGVYDDHGILTSRTVLAHAIHLNEQERQLIRERGSKISHCPVSNTYISSGMCPVQELLNTGIEVGLGTDVSGGWSPSVLVAAREAIGVSRNLAAITKAQEQERQHVLDRGNNSGKTIEGTGKSGGKLASEEVKLSPEEALYMATLGGAKCLGLGDRIGSFEVGKVFDAQLITCHNMFSPPPSPQQQRGGEEARWEKNEEEQQNRETEGKEDADKKEEEEEEEEEDMMDQNHPVEFWGNESWADKVAKWIYCGDDRNTEAVWVAGREVHRRR